MKHPLHNRDWFGFGWEKEILKKQGSKQERQKEHHDNILNIPKQTRLRMHSSIMKKNNVTNLLYNTESGEMMRGLVDSSDNN
uniref:Uncharacterized protein n=1 Tax=Heterorhabditis bacteriophora TaxID=37862 RepID=A0A1I7X7T0_HETBA